MELDNLKQTLRHVRAPEPGGGGGSLGPAGTDSLLGIIKATDQREYRQIRKALPFYLVAAAVFALGCVVGLAGAVSSRAVHLGVLAAILLLLSILALRRLGSIRGLDYAAPVRLFLVQTENRYRFIRPVDLAYSIPLLLVLGTTGGFAVVDSLIPRRLAESQLPLLLTVYGLFFAAVCSMGVYFTYKNWKRDKGRVFDDVRRIRRELESE
jgi:hypothetical protein